jgi:AraC family transcriptional regulator, transcriptional activator of the genes for pyochelin and ferripyochelin receptors
MAKSPNNEYPVPLLPDKHIVETVRLVKKIIDQNFDETIPQKYLCKKSGFNRTTLNIAFRILYGFSTKEYQAKLKIERAKRLLQETADRITDIAYQLGYQHPCTFSIEFKKRVGVSPNGWRRGRFKE